MILRQNINTLKAGKLRQKRTRLCTFGALTWLCLCLACPAAFAIEVSSPVRFHEALPLDRAAPVHPEREPQSSSFARVACEPILVKQLVDGVIYRPGRYNATDATQLEEEYEINCVALGVNYRTVLNLLRPVDPGDFSGLIIVEPTHPSNIWPIRSNSPVYLARAGHASVVINSNSFAVERLVKPANPPRYKNLSVPEFESLESEILHQLGLAIKNGDFGLTSPVKLILAGYSNTGARVRDYIDYFNQRYDNVYDGYLINQTAVGTLPGPVPELNVPVIELQGERELITTLERNPAGLGYRRADGLNYRLYEVAGLSHLDTSDPSRWSFPPADCGIDNPSSFPFTHIWNVALARLTDWVLKGEPAPHAPRLDTDQQGVIIRNPQGNAAGGLPTPQVRVPVATLLTVSPPGQNSNSRCDMIGPQINFSNQTLRELYGDHANYVQTLEQELDRLISAGWYLQLNRQEVLDEAASRASWFEN